VSSERKQQIIRAAIAANPDIAPERIAKIVTLVWTMLFASRGHKRRG